MCYYFKKKKELLCGNILTQYLYALRNSIDPISATRNSFNSLGVNCYSRIYKYIFVYMLMHYIWESKRLSYYQVSRILLCSHSFYMKVMQEECVTYSWTIENWKQVPDEIVHSFLTCKNSHFITAMAKHLGLIQHFPRQRIWSCALNVPVFGLLRVFPNIAD